MMNLASRTPIPRISHLAPSSFLHNGRNKVWLTTLDGQSVVVKQFKSLGLLKGIIYTFFRKSKARRAYENAQELLRRGIHTPAPIAYQEDRRWGLVHQVYYVCAPTDWQPIHALATDSNDFPHPLATAYAHFVAELHQKGILHRDLNAGNVLYKATDKGYSFQLIDINRMTFYPENCIPKAECMENLSLLWWFSPAYQFILKAYAEARGWSEADQQEAIRIKKRHDRRWIRRKNFFSLLLHQRLKYKNTPK